jgi:hypothetical protein
MFCSVSVLVRSIIDSWAAECSPEPGELMVFVSNQEYVKLQAQLRCELGDAILLSPNSIAIVNCH